MLHERSAGLAEPAESLHVYPDPWMGAVGQTDQVVSTLSSQLPGPEKKADVGTLEG